MGAEVFRKMRNVTHEGIYLSFEGGEGWFKNDTILTAHIGHTVYVGDVCKADDGYQVDVFDLRQRRLGMAFLIGFPF